MDGEGEVTTMRRSVNLERRSLISGQGRVAKTPMLPPWSVSEDDFFDLCTRCGDCIAVCPETILKPGSGGFPTTDFSHGECTFCGDCVAACSVKALHIHSNTSQDPWQQAPSINNQCLALNSVICRSCGDVCEPEAIKFEWRHAVATPVVDNELCSGCGACIGICPNSAMTMQPNNMQSNNKEQETPQSVGSL